MSDTQTRLNPFWSFHNGIEQLNRISCQKERQTTLHDCILFHKHDLSLDDDNEEKCFTNTDNKMLIKLYKEQLKKIE